MLFSSPWPRVGCQRKLIYWFRFGKKRFKECEGKKADKSGHQESNHIRIYSYRLRSPPYLLISWPFSLVHSLERDFSFRVIRSTLPPWNPRLGQRVVWSNDLKILYRLVGSNLKNPGNRSLSSPHWSDTRALHPRILYYGASGISCSPHLLLYQENIKVCLRRFNEAHPWAEEFDVVGLSDQRIQ